MSLVGSESFPDPNPSLTQVNIVFLPRGVRCSAGDHRGMQPICLKCSCQHKMSLKLLKESTCNINSKYLKYEHLNIINFPIFP
jgi:hypothetical protein